jgi:hypothetical protein
MADPVSVAFVDLLRGDATLGTLLQDNTYEGVTPVFTTDPVPDDAEVPYIQTPGQVGDDTNLNMDGTFRELTRQVFIYFPKSGDSGPVEDAALRVKNLVTQTSLVVAGYRTVFVNTQGPIISNPDEDTYGRLVLFTIWLYPSP